jgi:prolyl-tRNA editing enzyme YbaK/EbsC (Cys-tRNA(Pro) deacylase)
MSKSVARVEAALAAAGIAVDIRRMDDSTRTAAEAAAAVGCALDQIVKSIVFQGAASGHVRLFLTAGGNRVDPSRAAGRAGAALGKADAARVRAETGFAIGGVAPVGHLAPVPCWLDPRLLAFPVVWAAAGTPNHVFPIEPQALVRLTGATVAPFTG